MLYEVITRLYITWLFEQVFYQICCLCDGSKVTVELDHWLHKRIADEECCPSECAHGFVGGIQDWLDLVLEHVDEPGCLDDEQDGGKPDDEKFKAEEDHKYVPDGGGFIWVGSYNFG